MRLQHLGHYPTGPRTWRAKAGHASDLDRVWWPSGEILTDLSGRGVLFGLRGSVYDWNDPFGRLFLQALAMVAELKADLGNAHPKLPEPARRSIRRRYAEGEVSLADLATEYSVGRSAIHRIIHGAEAAR
ncbi:hypothetical protein [Nonomuraea sp. NPDC050691]|uniref:hypothetical protein n=1 Tax=Nonomuraea sp. NPDC050691 TaxID=3155661 RepID=UPI0033FEA9D2